MRQLQIKAVYLQLLIMFLAHWGWGFLQWGLLSPALFSSWRITTLWLVNTFIFLCDLMQSVQINSIHWRKNASAFAPEHISQVASTFPCTFSIFTWSSFIRLIKTLWAVDRGRFVIKQFPSGIWGTQRGGWVQLGYSTEVHFKVLIWLVGLGFIRVGLGVNLGCC